MAELGPLRTIAVEQGDVDLFPEVVLRLYDQGKRHQARAALLEAAKREPDRERADRQSALAGTLELWVMPVSSAPPLFTLNGCGFRIYTAGQGPDGTQIGVHWITILFVPVFPISAYLVTPTGGGWRFYANVPLPRWTWAVPGGFAGLAALVLLTVVLPAVWWELTHVDVVAYNGFDQDLDVRVGAVTERLAPRGHHRFGDVPTEPVEVAAAVPGGRILEAFTADLAGHGGQLAVYDPLARALLSRDWIRYGDGDPPEGAVLAPVSWQYVASTDYVFEEPPAEKRVKGGRHIDDSVLRAIEPPPGDIRDWFEALIRQGYREHALAAAEAEWRLHPEDNDLVWQVASAQDDPAAYVRRLRDEFPDDVGVHRAFQDFCGLEPAAVRAEYEARLAAAPADAMAHYLAGRPLADDEPLVALARYEAALARDPGYLPALRAAAGTRARMGDYAPAAALYGRYVAGGGLAMAVSFDRMALAQILGEDPAPAEPGSSVVTLADMVAADRTPREIDRIVAEVLARDAALEPVVREWIEAELRIVAGDLARTRDLVKGEQNALVALRLALSDGATPADRTDAAARLPEPEQVASHLRVLAYALLTRVDPSRSAAWRDSLAEEGLGWLPALLDDDDRVRDASRVDEALAGRVDLRERGAVWSALAFLHPSEETRRRARQFALPGDRPWFARR